MELVLSLGEASKPFPFVEKTATTTAAAAARMNISPGLEFCMGLGAVGVNGTDAKGEDKEPESIREGEARKRQREEKRVSADPPFQLDLLPPGPVPRNQPSSSSSSQLGFPWQTGNGSSGLSGTAIARGFDVNRFLTEEADDGAVVSSPNSTQSSYQMDFSMFRGGSNGSNRRHNTEATDVDAMNDIDTNERASSRASDEDDNSLARKKLRLSKEQSAFLEESFKEHNTLNPKQKLALAKQLNLRPRQVEVWFQNRRARTKLKQTEVDCEYLKRCCETLTEENRRLQKELQELRALKTCHPFYMQPPATTLSMCPSCERVATTSATTTTAVPAGAGAAAATTANTTVDATPVTPTRKPTSAFSLTKPRFYPFTHTQAHPSPAS